MSTTIENGTPHGVSCMPFVLTPRQAQVWTRVAHGERPEAIALTLGVSRSAVRYDVRAVIKEIGAQNITNAAVMLVWAGIVELDPTSLLPPLLHNLLRKKLRSQNAA